MGWFAALFGGGAGAGAAAGTGAGAGAGTAAGAGAGAAAGTAAGTAGGAASGSAIASAVGQGMGSSSGVGSMIGGSSASFSGNAAPLTAKATTVGKTAGLGQQAWKFVKSASPKLDKAENLYRAVSSDAPAGEKAYNITDSLMQLRSGEDAQPLKGPNLVMADSGPGSKTIAPIQQVSSPTETSQVPQQTQQSFASIFQEALKRNGF